MNDLCWEHSQHDKLTPYLIKNCSECYKEFKERLEDRKGFTPRERELELAGEQSAHSEQGYW